MKKTIIPIILSCLILLFPSCITNKQKLYLQDEQANGLYTPSPFEEYRLRQNDEILYYLMTAGAESQYLYNMGGRGTSYININNPVSFKVYEDGCVVLPTVGKIYIEKMTLREAERAITERFKSVATDAEVKISLANNYFYVEGDKGKGRFFAYKENLNIFQALAMAGDISSRGDKSKVKIIRRGDNGKDDIHTFDLRKASIIESEYFYVRPNDVIYIPTNPLLQY